jgi:hypothetical protein
MGIADGFALWFGIVLAKLAIAALVIALAFLGAVGFYVVKDIRAKLRRRR